MKAPRMSYNNIRKWVSLISGRGATAEYNHVNDHWGFKWFRSVGACLENYAFQLEAFRNGWGPAIGRYPVTFKREGGVRFGFLTERVKTYFDFCSENKIPYEAAYVNGNPNYERYCGFDFVDKCKELGWQIEDEHGGNLGFSLVDNRPLWIDFGFFQRTSTRAEKAHSRLINTYEKRIKDYCSAPIKKAVASGFRPPVQA